MQRADAVVQALGVDVCAVISDEDLRHNAVAVACDDVKRLNAVLVAHVHLSASIDQALQGRVARPVKLRGSSDSRCSPSQSKLCPPSSSSRNRTGDVAVVEGLPHEIIE